MKIDYVIMSTNDLPLYYEFWEPVSKIWKTKFNIHPILVFCGDTKMNMSTQHGDVYYLPSVKNIPSNILSLWGRCFVTKYFLENTCLIVDIDLVPISKKYIIEDIEDITNNDTYIHLRAGAYTKDENSTLWKTDKTVVVPGCYHLAKGKIFNQLYQFLDWEEEMYRIYNSPFKTNKT